MKRFAELTLVAIFSLTIVFHLLVLTSIIPHDIVWGSRLSTTRQVLIFETISIVLNGLFLAIMLIKIGFLKMNVSHKVLRGLQWGMFALFLLNTLGNLVSENSFEKMVFTPVTICLSICLLISLLSKQTKAPVPIT